MLVQDNFQDGRWFNVARAFTDALWLVTLSQAAAWDPLQPSRCMLKPNLKITPELSAKRTQLGALNSLRPAQLSIQPQPHALWPRS